MNSKKQMDESYRCPVCETALLLSGSKLVCSNKKTPHKFPFVDGRPVLINEANSIFTHADFVGKARTFFRPSPEHFLKRFARSLMPSVDSNVGARGNYRRFAETMLEDVARPRVLVIGGSVEGAGFEALSENPNIELVRTDVAWGESVDLICDIHDLPFRDGAFDGVVVQAVLEHVLDPFRGVDEIHRVLKPRGVVYAETPFMQQVHGGRYDFMRFTFLGHRRLFRRFEEIEMGAVCGPGMALAWSWRYFWWSFTENAALRQMIVFFTNWTAFFWKYFDRILVNKPRALDAASGYFFMGRRSKTVLSDRDLLAIYDRVNPLTM